MLLEKNKNFKFLLLTFTFVFSLLSFCFYAFAEEDAALVSLAQKIIESKPAEDPGPLFSELTDTYFKNNKYDDCAVFLKSLVQKRSDLEPVADYFLALARFTQLKYLEDSQGWDEYFSKGNSYREELENFARKADDSLGQENPLKLYARLLLWRFHNDQQDALREKSLSDLMEGVLGFSRKTAQGGGVLKEVADRLFAGGEKLKSREVYRQYVDILTKTESNDANLKAAASKFYSDGNIAISEEIFNAYIQRKEKSGSKETLVPELLEIAKLFCASDAGQKDAAFSEELFKKIEQLGGKVALDQDLSYLRAYNLEKAKDFLPAKDAYIDLIKRFPQHPHADEANFKIGIIYTYVGRDLVNGRAYFDKLSQKEAVSPQVISSFYQLGLLSQWEKDLPKAKEYYTKVIEKAKEDFLETAGLAKERLKEIEENKPVEYNLKTFLDVSLKKESASYDMRKLDLDSAPYKTKPALNVNIHSLDYPTDSGCMQPELQYLWSGHLGKDAHPASAKSFDTSYNHKGTKEINLVVVSPSGTLDYSIDMVDID
ncbi:MAG: tetratricopeptide repeat protein [Candidatus Omnitrophica bacterium]|nr:tetratricopeptide repeat protein [Candidatus Omnitrophota bacterium]